MNHATFRGMRKIKACGRLAGAAPDFQGRLPHVFILRVLLNVALFTLRATLLEACAK